MRISEEDVERVAKLARLEITESEKETFSRHLSSILTYMETLKALDTEGVEPVPTIFEQSSLFREDRAGGSLSPNKALANAPERRDGFFVVPRIIEDR
jgi:aspartyl-tRNA(Asn)/glutamyl-tRNA(Gln) amidotransferase subunit C